MSTEQVMLVLSSIETASRDVGWLERVAERVTSSAMVKAAPRLLAALSLLADRCQQAREEVGSLLG